MAESCYDLGHVSRTPVLSLLEPPRLGHCQVHPITDMRLQPDEALKVQETCTDCSSRRWKDTLIAMKIYALQYPTYDFKFAVWVRATMQEAAIGSVTTRH